MFEKTHPQFCHCAMCETTTAVQNMTVYGAGDEDENIDQTPVDATTEIPEKFIINGKDVKIGQAIGEGGFGAVYKGKPHFLEHPNVHSGIGCASESLAFPSFLHFFVSAVRKIQAEGSRGQKDSEGVFAGRSYI